MFQVGDEVIYVEPFYSRREPEVGYARVVKVGTKYAYITHPRWRTAETPFDKHTGIEHRNDGYNNNLQRIWTPEAWEAKKRRDKVLQNLRLHRVRFDDSYGDPKLSTEVLEQIDALLDGSLASKPAVTVL